VDEQGPLGVEWCDKDFWAIDTAYYASTLTPDVDLKYLYHLVKFIGLNHLKDGTSNPTLQAMALFQSWFLDLDPVRQKMDRNQPSTRASGHPSPNGRRAGGEGRFALDPATAALFPEHLEDSAPGPIPKGWKAGTVVEGFNLTMEQSPPGETYNEEGNVPPFYQGRTDFSFRFPTRRIYCSAPTRYAKPGDTLVSVRTTVGTSTLRMRNAASGVVSQPCATNPARPHSPITLWRTSIPTSPASRPREPSSGPSIKIASRNFPS
jgi:type I restriction enzyme S subunit